MGDLLQIRRLRRWQPATISRIHWISPPDNTICTTKKDIRPTCQYMAILIKPESLLPSPMSSMQLCGLMTVTSCCRLSMALLCSLTSRLPVYSAENGSSHSYFQDMFKLHTAVGALRYASANHHASTLLQVLPRSPSTKTHLFAIQVSTCSIYHHQDGYR